MVHFWGTQKVIFLIRDIDDATRVGVMSWCYAKARCTDPDATLDDVREAVTTLEDTERIARRVFGCTHPMTKEIAFRLQNARATLRTRETPSRSP